MGGLAYQATVGTGPAYAAAAQTPAADDKLRAELEALRKENDLLRRSLELALDKIKTQEAELRTLRGGKKTPVDPFQKEPETRDPKKAPPGPSSTSGKLQARADGDTIRILDAGSGKEILAMKHPGPVMALAFTPDAHDLISAGKDRTVRCWDVPTGKIVWQYTFSNGIAQLSVSADGKTVAVTDDDKNSLLLDLRTGKLLKENRP
jgi:hypothetical protein